jgi:hypothetical protein
MESLGPPLVFSMLKTAEIFPVGAAFTLISRFMSLASDVLKQGVWNHRQKVNHKDHEEGTKNTKPL